MKKVYSLIFGLFLSLIAFSQSPTCSWYPTCGTPAWPTNVKPVCQAYYFSPGLFTNDTDAIDYLWNTSPADSINMNGYIGVLGSPSSGTGRNVPPTGFYACAKMLYDANYLYILTKVIDPTGPIQYNSTNGTSTAADFFEVEVAPYDSFTNVTGTGTAILTTDYEDEYAYWNALGARKMSYYLDGWVTEYNYIGSGAAEAAANTGFYDCWSNTRVGTVNGQPGYESLLLMSFTWAMSSAAGTPWGSGATITGAGTNAYAPVQGGYIAFNVTVNEYENGQSGECQGAWSTNNNDIWATMALCGKLEFEGTLPNLPCTSCMLDTLGLLTTPYCGGPCGTKLNSISASSVRILSNPVTNEIMFSDFVQSVKVINLVGTTVAEATGTQDINVSDLSEGLYIVKYVTENGAVITEKIVKK